MPNKIKEQHKPTPPKKWDASYCFKCKKWTPDVKPFDICPDCGKRTGSKGIFTGGPWGGTP